MRPHKRGPAHASDALAELVCSNSLRGASLENAVGLLKEELARMGSLIVTSAREAAVPAGGALAVDRERFAALVEARLAALPNVRIVREEVVALDPSVPTIVACGPLPSEALSAALDGLLARAHPEGDARGRDSTTTMRPRPSWPRSRSISRRCTRNRGTTKATVRITSTSRSIASSTRNCSTTCASCQSTNPRSSKSIALGKIPFFEGCLPIEEMAARGDDTLRYGPLKPVGLRDPRTGLTPYAVVQLRKENESGSAYNLVGFQTRLTWPAQRETFAKLPGLR